MSSNVLDLAVVSCVPALFLFIMCSFPYAPTLSQLPPSHPGEVIWSQRTTRRFSRGDTELNSICSGEGGGMGKGQRQKTIWIHSQPHSEVPLLRTQLIHELLKAQASICKQYLAHRLVLVGLKWCFQFEHLIIQDHSYEKIQISGNTGSAFHHDNNPLELRISCAL